MLCVSASMPVAAVTGAGSASVSSGSANTALASSFGLNTERLTCVSSSPTTAERPTSLPVPEVVGSATKCGSSCTIGRTRGWSHTYSITSPSCTAISATTLATSSAAPPPKPITASARCALKAAAPAMTWLAVGLPNTPSNTSASRPCRCERNSASSGSFAKARSVTISGRRMPCSFRCAATSVRAPAPKWIVVGKEKRVMVMDGSDDLEVALALPVGHRILPLPVLPLARGGEVVDEQVAEPVARQLAGLEDARRLDQRARRARDVLGPLVGTGDRRRGEFQPLLDAVQ